jgi:hypothetical protein
LIAHFLLDAVFSELLPECRAVNAEKLRGGGPIMSTFLQDCSQKGWLNELQVLLVKA